jgi:hypothetical protein
MTKIENAINYLNAMKFIKKNSLVDLNVEYLIFIKKPERVQHEKVLKMGGYSNEEIQIITKNRKY